MTPQKTKKEIMEEFVEKGADLEHERWASWQKHIMENSFKIEDYGEEIIQLTIPREWWERWERLINTKYEDLTEELKESDRKETRNYLPFLSTALDRMLEVSVNAMVGEIELVKKRIIGGRPKWKMHNIEKMEVDIIEDIISIIKEEQTKRDNLLK